MNTKKVESELAKRIGTRFRFSPSGIGTRISEIVRRLGGARKLSDLIGVSEAQIYRYMKIGEDGSSSSPTIEPLALIAQAGEVSLDWLVFGLEEDDEDAVGLQPMPQAGNSLDLELMRQIIEGVEEGLEIAGLEQAPDGKAQFILTIYNWFKDSNPNNPKEEVLRLFVPDGKERIGGGSARRNQSDDEDVPPKAAR